MSSSAPGDEPGGNAFSFERRVYLRVAERQLLGLGMVGDDADDLRSDANLVCRLLLEEKDGKLVEADIDAHFTIRTSQSASCMTLVLTEPRTSRSTVPSERAPNQLGLVMLHRLQDLVGRVADGRHAGGRDSLAPERIPRGVQDLALLLLVLRIRIPGVGRIAVDGPRHGHERDLCPLLQKPRNAIERAPGDLGTVDGDQDPGRHATPRRRARGSRPRGRDAAGRRKAAAIGRAWSNGPGR